MLQMHQSASARGGLSGSPTSFTIRTACSPEGRAEDGWLVSFSKPRFRVINKNLLTCAKRASLSLRRRISASYLRRALVFRLPESARSHDGPPRSRELKLGKKKKKGGGRNGKFIFAWCMNICGTCTQRGGLQKHCCFCIEESITTTTPHLPTSLLPPVF